MLVLAEPSSDLVRERWARAAGLGVARDGDAYPSGTSDVELIERRERLFDVFRDEHELLELVVGQLATGRRVALLADRDGVILSSRSERGAIDPVTRARLVEGARWAEDTRGTNAIGTAVAEGRALGVVGAAHFELRNRDIFCYATPIRDAYGDIVAVLDVSGPVSNHDLAVGIAVQTAGFALSRALRASAFADANGGALGAIERLVHHASGPAMLIEASGVVRVVNERARAALPLPPPGAALSCERVFGVSFPELDAAAGQKDTRFQTRTGTYRLTIDRVAGDARRTLALLVYFEYQASPTTRSGSTQVSTPPALEPSAFDVILGNDVSLVRAKALASRFAKTELPVLLLAETGTGKELFAHAIHETSPRAARPFVALNCGALSPQLIASELFGHGPGAFTGASRGGTEGRIGAASGGTLFLDEIAEMPEDLQAALLRVLDDGVYQRVGETRDRRADFRLVSATSRDLPAMVRDGRFRSDLFYRIKGACVTIPALRDRSDVAFVAERLLHASMPGASLAMDASQFIAEHTWPGNVRELKSAIMHALALADGTVITRAHLPDVMITGLANTSDPAPTTRKALVREAIDATLRVCAGNVSEAARRLGVGRGTIYRAVRKPPTR